ncbi:MAG: thiamine diphosphokinase [Ruminococcus sp.]|nr:thiamine diphosphokinase [Ruminococcus sp.]
MKRCVIFVGGDPVSESTLDRELIASSFIIAADIGYVCCERLGIKADVIIGDFDSAQMPSAGNLEVFPVEKDDPDIMLAIKKALSLGCDDITVYGGAGGRLDHTVSNTQSLAYCYERDVKCRMVSDNERVELLSPDRYELPYMEGFSLSLFAYNSEVKGLDIMGCKYSGEGFTLTPSFPLGVSNCVTQENAVISFKSGCILCIRSRL